MLSSQLSTFSLLPAYCQAGFLRFVSYSMPVSQFTKVFIYYKRMLSSQLFTSVIMLFSQLSTFPLLTKCYLRNFPFLTSAKMLIFHINFHFFVSARMMLSSYCTSDRKLSNTQSLFRLGNSRLLEFGNTVFYTEFLKCC
jgi:hypothetical protein